MLRQGKRSEQTIGDVIRSQISQLLAWHTHCIVFAIEITEENWW